MDSYVMRYTERKEFLYDMQFFGLRDTQIALRMYAEWVKASSSIPYPKFFEVDRSSAKIDDLWHIPLTDRTLFSRVIELPAIAQFDKPSWKMKKLGLIPQQQFRFITANLHLHPLDDVTRHDPNGIHVDYFPTRGDMVFYNGYRLMITSAIPDPSAYWGQTNVWMGLLIEASIAPEGDAKPIPDLSKQAPAEEPTAAPMADWPADVPTGPANIPHNWP